MDGVRAFRIYMTPNKDVRGALRPILNGVIELNSFGSALLFALMILKLICSNADRFECFENVLLDLRTGPAGVQ